MNHEEHEDREDRPSWRLCREIIGCALRVHEELGPGLLESSYATCLAHELVLTGIPFEREKAFPIRYREVLLESGLRVDFVVANEVVVELKAVEALLPVHSAQMLTYLKMTRLRAGLLMNFNVRLLKYGIRRFVL